MQDMIKIQEELKYSMSRFHSRGPIVLKLKDEIEIIWESPQQPSCNSSKDCKDWPNSTCNIAIDEKKRCLCKQSFLWDGTILNCTTRGKDASHIYIFIKI